jgi:formylglycine-generating enzyme required for sulfatase activity
MLYWSLLENPGGMRPVTTVRVGPQLVARGPGHVFSLAEATAALERSVFRVPSEAEWEYLARGGVAGELTYFGAYVPDDPGDYLHITGLTEAGSNAFGVWGFGFEPELCADVYATSHDGAAMDGTPRRGAGPRVARGGAGARPRSPHQSSVVRSDAWGSSTTRRSTHALARSSRRSGR